MRAYIREIDQNGLLDEVPCTSKPAPALGVSSERWLDSVKAVRSNDKPPTFSSLDLSTEDGTAKAMMFKEENMKFPRSMKLDLRQPEIRRNTEIESRQRRTSGNSHRLPPQIPRLITSDEKDEKTVQYYNTESSSGEESEQDCRRRFRGLELGEVIKTAELIADSQALQLRPHSPSSFRSNQDYLGEDSNSRTIPFQAKKQLELGTSPVKPGAIPIPQANPRTSNSSFSITPHSYPFRLAPDEYGKEIPADAKWTKINRRLVSPEVLDQDHRRYEA